MSDIHFQTVDATSTASEELYMMDKAKEVGDYLHQSYPGHMWAISWHGPALVIKSLGISSFYGMSIDMTQHYSSSQLKDKAKKMAGELLERANIARGAWKGNFAEELDGSEKRFFKKTDNV